MITGGAGFIGSHVVRLFVNKYPDYRIVNLDALTYAGQSGKSEGCGNMLPIIFLKKEILTDSAGITGLFEKYHFDAVIHLAAESHVDRSILDPLAFVKTNVMGTCTLLNVCRKQWGKDAKDKLFYHVSTDEVYGSLGTEGYFTETTAYDPRSPYSASKASSDHFVMAYHHTYGLPVIISNCSNNYGSHHFPGKADSADDQSILKITGRCRYMARGKMYATGYMWMTMHGRLIPYSTREGSVKNIISADSMNGKISISCICFAGSWIKNWTGHRVNRQN